MRIPALPPWRPLLTMTKPRLTSMVLLTTAAGYYIGHGGADLWRVLALLAGTGLLGGGASALNMLIERHRDAQMHRTRTRPLVSGALTPVQALVFGTAISTLGLLTLALGCNLLTAFVGAVTLTSYLFVYTPLKALTPLNTLVGAVPGALPPVMGWTAARGTLEPAGLLVFALLFLWQIPHFLAIAWLYREDYQRGGYRMLPAVDPSGSLTASQVLNGCVALLVASLLPTLVGLAGTLYFAGAIVAGMVFTAFGVSFLIGRSDTHARRLFASSLLYLPVVLLLLVIDRAPLGP